MVEIDITQNYKIDITQPGTNRHESRKWNKTWRPDIIEIIAQNYKIDISKSDKNT